MSHRCLTLGLVLVSLAGPSFGAVVPAEAAMLAPAARGPKPKTSSQLLKEGEAQQQKGENAKAGQLYRQALEALADQKRRANEGARAAMLASDAFWLAFEQDLDPNHLQAAADVLSVWLTLTGPDSRASLRGEVERRIGQFKALREKLGEADAALAQGRVADASARYGEVLDALVRQQRPWSVGARIVLRASAGFVAVYDANVPAPAVTSERLVELETARDLLVRWRDARPTDEASPEEPAVEERIAAVEAKIQAEKGRAELARADEARAAEDRLEEAKDAKEKADEEKRQREVARELERDRKQEKRRAAGRIAMIATGTAALGAGLGLLGEGLAYRQKVAADEADANAEADAYEQMPGVEFDRVAYEAAWDDLHAQVDPRNLGMIIGGSVLAAGGLAVGVVGVVKLVKARKRGAGSGPRRARLVPSASFVTVQF